MKLITVICTALMAFSLTACARIYTEREQAHILPEESITMQSLLTVGTSACPSRIIENAVDYDEKMAHQYSR